jgi:hypothetical protein
LTINDLPETSLQVSDLFQSSFASKILSTALEKASTTLKLAAIASTTLQFLSAMELILSAVTTGLSRTAGELHLGTMATSKWLETATTCATSLIMLS